MVVRLAFGALLIGLTALLFVPLVTRLLARRSAVTVLLYAFVGSQVAAWFATYLLLGDVAVHSDLALYYAVEADLAMSGAVPYRDFPSSYGPLFPYLLAPTRSTWRSLAAIALPLVVCEVAAVMMLVHVTRTRRAVADHVLARSLFVYTLNPAALYWSGMLAYNSSVVLLFWVYSVAQLLRHRSATSAAALGASIMVGKFLERVAKLTDGPLVL